MSSTQSNDSLRELNAKLLAKICELRKKVTDDEVEKTKLIQEIKARTLNSSSRMLNLEIESRKSNRDSCKMTILLITIRLNSIQLQSSYLW